MSPSPAAPRNDARVLVVEDDEALRELLDQELTDAGYAVHAVQDAQAALTRQREHPAELVISDLRLPGQDGLELLDALLRDPSPPAFVMITAFGTVEQAVDALKRGADDFLTKPLKLDHLRLTVERVLETRRLRAEVARYRNLLDSGDFHGIIGRSRVMRALFEQIRRLADASGPVLIHGESGTGKELVARAIHDQSSRRDGPFVAINCAGIPAELMESELFGHVAGAFTGARQARGGLFQEASGGTVLLDEIGEMPVAMQAKLLRVLENGTVRPVGGDREIEVDVRVLAATHRDLEAGVADGGFREDLFFRLETFTLQVPPLRDREDDLDLLTAHFIGRYAPDNGRVHGISPAAMKLLRAYRFPGNVRELANALERAAAFCQGEQIGPDDLPARVRRARRGNGSADTAGSAPWDGQDELPTLEQVEQRYIEHVLQRLGGNKRRAAQVLGIGRRTLYRRLGLSTG